MKVSEKMECTMCSELVSMILEQEECGQAKEYDNVVYIVLTNPVKLWDKYEYTKEFCVIGFVDQEDENIMVGNLDENNKPSFEEAENYRNGVLTIYAQLCGIKLI